MGVSVRIRTQVGPSGAKQKILRDLRGTRVDVGPMGQGGGPAPQYRERDGTTSSLTTADILAIQEVGTDRIPARPVMAFARAATRRKVKRIMRDQLRQIIRGRSTKEKMYAEIGNTIVAAAKARIMGRISPALAESTKADPDRDPRHIPLLDTGQIIESIRWTVRNG